MPTEKSRPLFVECWNVDQWIEFNGTIWFRLCADESTIECNAPVLSDRGNDCGTSALVSRCCHLW